MGRKFLLDRVPMSGLQQTVVGGSIMTDWLDKIIEDDTESLSQFEKHLEEVEKVLSEKGLYAGLCKDCLGTNYVFNFHDGYVFIEYNEEADTDGNSKMRLIKCAHGRDLTKGLPY